MLDFIQSAILWTLALYGLFEIIKSIISTLKKKKLPEIHIVIAVKNQEEDIEFFLRFLIDQILYRKEEQIKEIIVTDLKSTDKTKDILIKFAEDFDCVKFIDFIEKE